MTGLPFTLDEALIAAVELWNLFGLPVLLVGVIVGTIVVARRHGASGAPSWSDRRRVVRQIGLIHIGLALWGLTTVVDELGAYRTMGIFPSNPVTGLYGSVLGIMVDVPVGLGLLGLRRWARWAAVVLAAVRVGLAGLLTSWIWQFGASLDPTEWPRVAVARALPLFLLFVLLTPGAARAMKHVGPMANLTPGRFDGAIAMATRLFLIVLGSVVVTDAVTWAIRSAAELLGSAGPL
jgi:hypothetical protein